MSHCQLLVVIFSVMSKVVVGEATGVEEEGVVLFDLVEKLPHLPCSTFVVVSFSYYSLLPVPLAYPVR